MIPKADVIFPIPKPNCFLIFFVVIYSQKVVEIN